MRTPFVSPDRLFGSSLNAKSCGATPNRRGLVRFSADHDGCGQAGDDAPAGIPVVSPGSRPCQLDESTNERNAPDAAPRMGSE